MIESSAHLRSKSKLSLRLEEYCLCCMSAVVPVHIPAAIPAPRRRLRVNAVIGSLLFLRMIAQEGKDSDEDTEAARSNKHLLGDARCQVSRGSPPSVIVGYKVVGPIYNRGSLIAKVPMT